MLKTAIRADWRLLLFGMLMSFWSSPGQTYLIALFGGHIRESYGLSHGAFGSIYSAGTLLSAMVLMWSGKLVDRLPLRNISLAVILLLAIACGLMSVATTPLMLVVVIFLLRQSGQGMMTLISATAMVRYFDRIKGKASAIGHLGFIVAEAILPALVIFSIAMLGWRQTWQLGALLLVLLVPLVFWLLSGHGMRHQQYLDSLQLPAGENSQAPYQRQWTRGEVIRDPRFYGYLPAMLCPSFFFTGFFFHQVYLVEYKGWDLSYWGALFAFYAAISFFSTIISGPLVDRLGAIRHLPWYSIPLAFGLVALSLSDNSGIAFVFLALTGITTGWNPTVVGPFWADMYGSQHLASIKSLGTALMVLSSALSPFALGWLFDHGFALDHVAMASALIIAACTMLAYISLTSTRRQTHAAAMQAAGSVGL